MKSLAKIKPKEKICTDFFVFDTETKIRDEKTGLYKYGLSAKSKSFCFGVIVGYNYTKVIKTVDEFREEFLSLKYKGKICFAHNAEYDLNVIYDNIYKLDSKAVFNGKFITATNGNTRFADSMNVYNFSVKRLGEILQNKKHELDYSQNNYTENINDFTSNDLNYCIQDCQIVYDALLEFFEKVGTIKITLASLALYYYRSHFQPFHIDYNKYTDNFFDSYFGGRTEAFYIGKVKGHAVDFNSMYPYSMKYSKFPNPKYLQKIVVRKNRVLHYLQNFEGLISCTVLHKDFYFGFLPVKHKEKLIFPIGEFSGIWNFNEIRFAIECNVIDILKVDYIIYSKPMESPFVSYVDTLYEEKKHGKNRIEIEIAKSLLNNLYGKFAQRKKTVFEYVDDYTILSHYINELQKNKDLISIHLFNQTRNDAYLELENRKMQNMMHTIPVFSSYITSFARVHLLKKILEYSEKVKILYCDTDSIFFEGNYEVQNSSELGELKLELKEITEIRGLKNYSYKLNDKIFDNIKGIPKNAILKDNVFYYKSLVKTKESIIRQIESGELIEREKVIRHKYNKRQVLKNGDTKPIKL